MNDRSSGKPLESAIPAPADEAEPQPGRILPAAARRALAEAEARRAAAVASVPKAKELQGPDGPEPTRFGDWERKGIASDF